MEVLSLGRHQQIGGPAMGKVGNDDGVQRQAGEQLAPGQVAQGDSLSMGVPKRLLDVGLLLL